MINLPRYISERSLNYVFPFIKSVRNDKSKIININAANAKFIDPVGICLLASLCDDLKKNNRILKFHNLPDNLSSYLSRMNLLSHCGHVYIEKHNRLDRADSLVEVSCINEQSEVDRFSQKISKCIVGGSLDFDESAPPNPMTGYKPHEQLESNLIYLFNELLENALTHGKRHGYRECKVCIASQYYPKTDSLKIGTVDNGCGFLKTLEQHQQSPNSDYEAIELALKPYTSCNRDVGIMSDSYNEGVGLTVISRIIQQASGELTLFSGNAVNRYKGNSTKHFESKLDSWRGVGISIDVPRENLKNLLYANVVSDLRTESNYSTEIDIPFI